MHRKYECGRYHYEQQLYRMLQLHHQSNVCSPISFGHEVTFVMEYFLHLLLIYEGVPKDLRSRNEGSYHK